MISVSKPELETGLAKRRVQGDAGDDARQGDRQHDHQIQRLPTEELEPMHRERGEQAEDDRDHRGARCRLQADEQCIAGTACCASRLATSAA